MNRVLLLIVLASACGTSMMKNECTIGGVVFQPQATNPAPEFGVCQICTPAVTPVAWTNAKLGTACGPSLVCISGGRCSRAFRKLSGTGTGTWRRVTGSSADDVWVVGPASAAVRSTDRGATWTTLTLPGIESRFGVWSPSAGRAFVVGAQGTVIETQNGGQSWTELPQPMRQVLKGIWGTSPSEMFVVGTGGYVARSTNGGMTWTELLSMPDAAVQQTLNAIWGDASAIYAVGEGGTILRSTNRGGSWVRSRLSTTIEFSSVYGTGQGEVFVTGPSGTLLRTDDGMTWKTLTVPTRGDLTDVWGVGPEVYVTTQQGQVFRSTNSGESWAELSSAGAQILYGIWGSSADDLYAVGSMGFVLHQP